MPQIRVQGRPRYAPGKALVLENLPFSLEPVQPLEEPSVYLGPAEFIQRHQLFFFLMVAEGSSGEIPE